MNLSKEHVEILTHTRDRAAGGYFCGDSPAMQELVADGLMVYVGRKSFCPDPYFQLTDKGREALRKSKTKPEVAAMSHAAHSCPKD